MLRLKQILKDKGISGKDFAQKLDVTPATISNIINGTHFPKGELLKKIAVELDVDIRELFEPTKDGNKETLYLKKDGKFVPVGDINLDSLK